MDTSLKRRITVASAWASNRISVLDNNQKYEESYAITEEFREWITCLNQDSRQFEESVLKFPSSFLASRLEEHLDLDELLEL